ncbi:uncharacterized protein LOC135316641 isoform X1 [Phalacrocorax carbo]|uniref:uncharacterized protein LOC135316641 isoform X1 n=1 Tax=Phalacrocorax carbo TaxID=9209 RepID=UPI003119640F
MGELSLQEDAGICSSYAGLDLPTQGRARGADLVSLSSRTLLFSSYSAVTETTRLEEGKKKEKIKLMSRLTRGGAKLEYPGRAAVLGAEERPGCLRAGGRGGQLCLGRSPPATPNTCAGIDPFKPVVHTSLASVPGVPRFDMQNIPRQRRLRGSPGAIKLQPLLQSQLCFSLHKETSLVSNPACTTRRSRAEVPAVGKPPETCDGAARALLRRQAGKGGGSRGTDKRRQVPEEPLGEP